MIITDGGVCVCVWLPVIALNLFQCSLLFTVKLHFDAFSVWIDLEKQAMLQQELL